MSASPVLVARDGAVATITLNRPSALNVLDLAMVDALVSATQGVANDAAIRAALQARLAHPSALVREHVEWALAAK